MKSVVPSKGETSFSVANLEKILNEARLISSIQETDELICKVWEICNKVNDGQISIINRLHFQKRMAEAVFSNETFFQIVGEFFIERAHLVDLVMNDPDKKKQIDSSKIDKNSLRNQLISDEAKKQGSNLNEYGAFIKIATELAFYALAKFPSGRNPTEYRSTIRHALKELSRSLDVEIQRIAYSLGEILGDVNYNHEIAFDTAINRKSFFDELKLSAAFARSILIASVQSEVASEIFVKNTIAISEREKTSLAYILKKIYAVVHSLDAAVGQLKYICEEQSSNFNEYSDFFDKFISNNEKVLMHTLRIISKKMNTADFFESLLNRIEESKEDIDSLNSFCKPKLNAFVSKNKSGQEWANKIYLNTLKTLTILNALREAPDKDWVINVAVRELFLWIQESHEVINKFVISDDWKSVQPFLKDRIEGKEIEWKSSLYLPIQGKKFQKSRTLLKEIANTIISMMNSSGGAILVGLVEKPKSISTNLGISLHKRGGRTFFDLSSELSAFKTSYDDVRRDIQEDIASVSGTVAGNFDDYWNIKFLKISCNNKQITLAAIQIKDLPEPYICKAGQKIFIMKRVAGRNIEIDPRDEFDLKRKKS